MTNNRNIRPNNKIIADRYKVRKVVCGGMGVVYLCVDIEQNDFPVVLKTYKPQYLSDKSVRAQFLQEAAIWVEIGWHPNIVQAYHTEYVSATHEIYLVLELLPSLDGKEDPSLRSWLTPSRVVSIEKTLKLILEVTRGMKYATTKIPGLTHCDLKPDNIYIGPDGSARISDFGLVTVPTNILENLNCVVPPDHPTRLRPSGTPLYMSPEQWISRKVSISSDIYSLGCICLEMLTGGFTIRGRHMRNIAEEHIRGGALRRLEEADLPEALKGFLSKCLQPNSMQRFQTWECVEYEIINLYDVLLHQKIEPENILLDVSRKTQVLKGETILSIGEAYLDIHEIPAAINCFKKARSIAKLQNYQELLALAEANIGLAYFKLGQFERAIVHYQRAIAQYMEIGNREYAILNHGNVGNAYFRLGDFARAQDNITKVIQYTNQISQEKVKAFWKANLTNAISNAGSKKMALEYFLYTLEVEKIYGDNNRSVKFLDVLDMFMNGLGDSKKLTLVLNHSD